VVQGPQPCKLALHPRRQAWISARIFCRLINGNKRISIFLLMVLGQCQIKPENRLGLAWIQIGRHFQLSLCIGIIAGGRLIAEGTLEELRRQTGETATSLEDTFLTLVAEQVAAA
jgi:hypothetical protein